MTQYIVLTRTPMNNTGAYMVFTRAVGLQLQDLYFSEYADDAESSQYVGVGPVTRGDAKTIFNIMAAGNGDPIMLHIMAAGIGDPIMLQGVK